MKHSYKTRLNLSTNTDYEIVSEVFCKQTFTLSRKKSITKRNIFEPDGADDVVLVDAVVELDSACKSTNTNTYNSSTVFDTYVYHIPQMLSNSNFCNYNEKY